MERVRFAPSPTGPLHIGGLRTALFNYAYAKKHKGKFILRIEDTDQNRWVDGAEEYIRESLEWCGIEADEDPFRGGKYGPYKQSKRLAIYQEAVQKLIDNGDAYYAFDTPESLGELRKSSEARGETFKYNFNTRRNLDNSLDMDSETLDKRLDEPYVVRLKIENGTTLCRDEIRGSIKFNNEELEDKILMKADGYPTYHLANVVDDHLMKITTVIRGEEWLSSLPVHLLLYKAFGWDLPKFAHLPLILKPNGKGKLSKRDGDAGGFPVFPISWEGGLGFKEMGFLRDAMLNTMMLLGWNSGGDEEIITLEKFVEAFELSKVQKGGARFDFEKSKWLNQQYIRGLSAVQLVHDPFFSPLLDKFTEERLVQAASYVKDRLVLLQDLENEIDCFFEAPDSYDQKAIKKAQAKGMEGILNFLEETWLHENYDKDVLSNYCKEQGIGFGVAMQTLRLILVGSLKGPDVFDILRFLEKDVIFTRLNLFKSQIS